MLRIRYREPDQRAVLSWDSTDDDREWRIVLQRVFYDQCDDTMGEGPRQLSVPWWSFVSLRRELLELFRGYNLVENRDLTVEQTARQLLVDSTRAVAAYHGASSSNPLDSAQLTERLQAEGFTRQLTQEQQRNVAQLAAQSAGASFSVPGAGKTTEALAYFILRADSSDRLLVVSPKNAFASWEEQLLLCVPTIEDTFVRLRGGAERIELLLATNPRFMIIGYQQLVRVREAIARHLAQFPVFLFLDESHRIKSGVARQTAQSVLSLSHLPRGKLILSGTPMPQSVDDLVPQIDFLYPELQASPTNAVSLIQPIFVRTTKKQLGLPKLERRIKKLPMNPIQHHLYQLMKQEVVREATFALSIRTKDAFRSLGRSVTRLLQFVSNPALLSDQLTFAHPELLAGVLAEGDGPKVDYVLERARYLAADNQKVLIWSSFVRNVEYLAERLSDLGAVYIHGQVDTGDEDDDDTREGKIRLFHDDPAVKVLIANPAAASESISLHQVCHHALYLDRSFNAAHYMQSEDRIHRLGLAPHQHTNVEIVICTGTIDETVHERLRQKINAMAEVLNDSSIRIEPIPFESSSDDDDGGIGEAEAKALLRDLVQAPPISA